MTMMRVRVSMGRHTLQLSSPTYRRRPPEYMDEPGPLSNTLNDQADFRQSVGNRGFEPLTFSV